MGDTSKAAIKNVEYTIANEIEDTVKAKLKGDLKTLLTKKANNMIVIKMLKGDIYFLDKYSDGNMNDKKKRRYRYIFLFGIILSNFI